MKRKLKVQCPCGYSFETFSSKTDAIAIVKLHVESFHKDFLPFGIKKYEAQTLLKEEHIKIKPKITTRTAYSVQTEPFPIALLFAVVTVVVVAAAGFLVYFRKRAR